MLPLGHLAVGLIASDLLRGEPLAAAAGSQLPDVIDKPLAWVFNTTGSSRFLAHTLAAFAVATAGAYALGGERVARGVAAGYATHLAADQLLGGKVPFLWPFKTYRLAHRGFRLKGQPLTAEIVAAVYLWRRLAR